MNQCERCGIDSDDLRAKQACAAIDSDSPYHVFANAQPTAPELYDALCGMVGLVQLIEQREPELQHNHRFIEALRVIAQYEKAGAL